MSVDEADCASREDVLQRWKDLHIKVQDPARSGYLPRHAAPDDPPPATAFSPAVQRPNVLPGHDVDGQAPGQAAPEQPRQLLAAAQGRSLFRRAGSARTDERIAANGQADIARQLAKLGPDWKVLHAVGVGSRANDVDHVVIGPAGVFTVEVKIHPQARVRVDGDTVEVDGCDHLYVRNSRHGAARAAVLLSAATGGRVDVRGIVVVVGADRGLSVTLQPRDGEVAVVSRKRLLSHLRELPEDLDAFAVARIYEAAGQVATWQPIARYATQLGA